MIDRGKHNVVGILVDAVDYDAAVGRIVEAALAHRPYAVSNLAVHGVMTGVQDREHKYRLNNFDLVMPDGQPVRWALNLLHGTELSDNVRGTELTLRVCGRASALGLPLYLYGSTPHTLELMRQNLAERFPGIEVAGAEPSRFRRLEESEVDEVVERIRQSGARIVLVGLGCPRQEVWAYELRDRLGVPVLAVGAAFDFIGGFKKEAPRVLQRSGLEWAFRLVQEPARLWRRYLLLNPVYSAKVAAQKLRLARYDPRDAALPQPLRYG